MAINGLNFDALREKDMLLQSPQPPPPLRPSERHLAQIESNMISPFVLAKGGTTPAVKGGDEVKNNATPAVKCGGQVKSKSTSPQRSSVRSPARQRPPKARAATSSSLWLLVAFGLVEPEGHKAPAMVSSGHSSVYEQRKAKKQAAVDKQKAREEEFHWLFWLPYLLCGGLFVEFFSPVILWGMSPNPRLHYERIKSKARKAWMLCAPRSGWLRAGLHYLRTGDEYSPPVRTPVHETSDTQKVPLYSYSVFLHCGGKNSAGRESVTLTVDDGCFLRDLTDLALIKGIPGDMGRGVDKLARTA